MNKPTPAPEKHAIRFVLLAVFVYSAGFGIIMPVLPDLIIQLEGISLSEATWWGGLIASAYAVFQFLMGPLVGNLGDRYGRRPVFLLSLAGFSLDFLLMAFAQNIWWLFIGRSIAGGLGAIFGPANAVMADISSAADRAKRFGAVGAAFGIGFIAGPALGGFIGEYSARAPFFVAAAMSALVFLYGLVAFPETMPAEARRVFSLKRANPLGALLVLRTLPGVLGIALVYLVWVTSTNIYPVSWSYYAQAQYGWDSKTIGISLTLVGISMAVVQALLIGRMVSRFGERNTALFGLICAATGMLIMAFNNSGAVAMTLCLLLGLQGMIMPSVNAMMSRRTPDDMQGELQGFNGSLAALGALFAPLFYNTSLAYFTGPDVPYRFAGAPFIISAAFSIIAFLILIRLRRSNELA